jgi:uncharacterized membrane protein
LTTSRNRSYSRLAGPVSLSSAAAVASAACAAILLLSGIAKLVAPDERTRYRALAVGELLIAVGLLIPYSRAASLVVSVGLGLVFVGYSALRRQAPCRCFGDVLRAGSQRMRLWRSVAFLLLATVGAASYFAGGSAGPNRPLTAAVVGLVVGSVAVFASAATAPLHAVSSGGERSSV